MSISPPVLGLKVLHSRGQYAGLVAFFKFCDGEEPPPIYLFIHRYPNTISEVSSWLDECIPTHFWSFDETGQNQMSWDECEEWGLPYLIPYFNDIFGDDDAILETWPTEVYNALREWQIVQGFDPTTADFARHLGYPELEIMSMPKKTNTQSEQAQRSFSILYYPDEFAYTSDPDKENKPTSSWWEAIAGSGISAFAL
ncbi:hypothetical protein VNI00_002369 [Paramarasmius palmivorus]|uniref:Sulfotransferase n=1 Tax=Paramarasmius palmivorus TaxID=297713 RepID=A0AAW0DYI5_9AGAR